MKTKIPNAELIDSKILLLKKVKNSTPNSFSWIKTIRTSIKMTMQQLGKKLNISKQAISDFEKREMDGSITLNSLREIGNAMDMKLVYGFVPNEHTLKDLLNMKALEKATEIANRSRASMNLKKQNYSKKQFEESVKELAEEILNNNPSILWN